MKECERAQKVRRLFAGMKLDFITLIKAKVLACDAEINDCDLEEDLALDDTLFTLQLTIKNTVLQIGA